MNPRNRLLEVADLVDLNVQGLRFYLRPRFAAKLRRVPHIRVKWTFGDKPKNRKLPAPIRSGGHPKLMLPLRLVDGNKLDFAAEV